MDTYKQMYLTLFKAINEAVEALEKAQQAAEALFLEEEED